MELTSGFESRLKIGGSKIMENWEIVKNICILETKGHHNCKRCVKYKSGSGTCGCNCGLGGSGHCEYCEEASIHRKSSFRICPQIIHPDITTCKNWMPVKVDRRKENRRESDND